MVKKQLYESENVDLRIREVIPVSFLIVHQSQSSIAFIVMEIMSVLVSVIYDLAWMKSYTMQEI